MRAILLVLAALAAAPSLADTAEIDWTYPTTNDAGLPFDAKTVQWTNLYCSAEPFSATNAGDWVQSIKPSDGLKYRFPIRGTTYCRVAIVTGTPGTEDGQEGPPSNTVKLDVQPSVTAQIATGHTERVGAFHCTTTTVCALPGPDGGG